MKKLAVFVHEQVEMMHLSTNRGLVSGSRDGIGPHLNFGHGNPVGVEGRFLNKSLRLHQYDRIRTLLTTMRESQ